MNQSRQIIDALGGKVTAYHGTTPENAKAILADGFFRKGTWFAYHKAESIKFGGPVVFTVELEPSGFKGEDSGSAYDGWQFHLRDPLSTDVVTHIEGME